MPAPADRSDAELAALALAGEQAGYVELMRRHRDAVFRIARSNSGDDTEALDITQESFIAAFAALGRYDRTRPFRLWIARIAINKCRDWARRRAVRRALAFARPIGEAMAIADTAPTPEEEAQSRVEMMRITTAIADLPGSLREVLVLRAIEGMTQAETAQILAISEKAVETRLYRARNKLSGMLRDGEARDV